MPLDLDIKLDAANLRRFRLLERASRTMAAKSLTFTAQKAVPRWIAANSLFHKRRSWIDKGVRFRPATPSNLNAQVGSLDLYMGRHVKGMGQEKRAAGSKSLFIPEAPIGEQGTHTQTRAKLRRMMQTQRKPFIIKSKGGHLLLVRRKGKRHSAGLEILGTFAHEVKIKPRLDALALVDATVQIEFGPIYERLLLKWAESGRD